MALKTVALKTVALKTVALKAMRARPKREQRHRLHSCSVATAGQRVACKDKMTATTIVIAAGEAGRTPCIHDVIDQAIRRTQALVSRHRFGHRGPAHVAAAIPVAPLAIGAAKGARALGFCLPAPQLPQKSLPSRRELVTTASCQTPRPPGGAGKPPARTTTA
jgi:hypothetical protein